MAGQDRKACSLAQHHRGQGGGGPTRHHQEIACARLPVTVITRWWRALALGMATVPRRVKESRSSTPSTADQLTPISMIWPRRSSRASISLGSSRATDAVCGHHAPSRSSSASTAAKVTRVGLANRLRSGALMMLQSRPDGWPKSVGLQYDQWVRPGDPSANPSFRDRSGATECGRSAYESDRASIWFDPNSAAGSR
jgi:hypothetical protein